MSVNKTGEMNDLMNAESGTVFLVTTNSLMQMKLSDFIAPIKATMSKSVSPPLHSSAL